MTIDQARSALAALAVTLLAATATAADDGPAAVTLLATPEGGRPVAARSDREGTIHLLFDSGDGPKYARSADGGRTFGPPIAVVGPGARPEGLEYSAWDLAVGRGGRVHVALGTNAWKLKLPKEEWGYFYASLDSGAASFSPIRNINRTPSEGFSIAADDRGNVTACWLSGKLYANVSRDDGATFAPGAEPDGSYDPCNCCTTSAAYGADGRLAVLYREEAGNHRDMYLVLWDQGGGRVTRKRVGRTPWEVAACPMTYFSVVPGTGGFAAAWPTKGQIDFARLDAQGDPVGPAEVETPGRSGMRTGVLALPGPGGRTLVAWKAAAGRLGWQAYDAGGAPEGPPGSAEGPGAGVAGVVDRDGRFLLFR